MPIPSACLDYRRRNCGPITSKICWIYYPDNEAKLIATHEVWQITAFAELYANQAQGSNVLARVEPLYARADRLYTAALALQDELLIRQQQQAMLKNWAAVYRENGLEEQAAALEGRR